jgi:hypothetical protein
MKKTGIILVPARFMGKAAWIMQVINYISG